MSFCKLFIFTAAIVFMLLFFSYPVSYSQDAKEGADSGVAKSDNSTEQAKPKSAKAIEEERLLILKADIKKEIEQLNRLKKEIEDAKNSLAQKRQESIDKIVKIFESMPAEDAARRIEKLDENNSVLILSSLKPKVAGKILAQIEVEMAASISKKMIAKSRASQEKSSR
ncbi:MAG: hypothetical protein HQL10_04025 [Nitrospirae bacterium]|nr:hypothetical protein [Nitrospirota bacterium]